MLLKMLILFKVNFYACCNLDFIIIFIVCSAFTEVKTSRTKKRTTPSTSGVSSVTSVLFQNDYTLLSAGAADGYSTFRLKQFWCVR